MAHNRLERIGTIYTRVTGLIRSGAMKLEDRPSWYEIYQAFPPETPPRYDNPAPKGEIRKIFFPEDTIRAKFYRKLPSVPATSLNEDGRASACQTFLDNCRRLADSKGVTMEEVFDEALATTKEALIASRSEPTKIRSEVRTSRTPKNPKKAADIGGIFSEEPTNSPPSPKST
uniref:Small ribosomal subunit protein mS23 n=1 Tax=Lygus hesperus TaxID=30085 RepID=A0A0A9W935_LYGHE